MKKHHCLTACLCAFALLSLLATSVSAATLEGYWRLDEIVGPTAPDASPNGLNGTYSGGADPTALAPTGFSGLGTAADFNGTTAFVDLGTPAVLQGMVNDFSAEAWIKPDTIGGTRRIVSSTSSGWSFGILDGGFKLTTFGVKDYLLGNGSGLIPAGQWSHVAAVMDTDHDVTFYLNGQNVGKVLHGAPGNPGTGSFAIGSAGSEFFDGAIDEVAVFSGTLTQSEVQDHMLGGVLGGAAPLSLPYSNTFDTDTATFFDVHPEFTDFGVPVAVVGGVAQMTPSSASDSAVTIPGLHPPIGGSLVVEMDIGNTAESRNVGLRIGSNSILFHPGHTPTPGAFRVDGPGGFSNQDMGFVPAIGALHHFRVEMFHNGLFEIEVTDANNPANVHTASFTNINSVGGAIGFHRGIGADPGDVGLYDNLSIATVAATGFHYSLSASTALPTLLDQGAHTHDATAGAGAALSTDVPVVGVGPGMGDRSLDTTGGGAATDDARLLDNDVVAAAGGFTMEAWFKYNGGAGTNKIIDYAGTENLSINTATNEVLFRINSNGLQDSIIGTVTPGQWHYAAVVFDTLGAAAAPDPGFANESLITGVAHLYLDGALVGTTGPLTISGFGDSLNLPIGRPIGIGQHPFGGEPLQGLIYEPRVSLGALGQGELLYVPEPGTLMLVLIGATLAALRRTRRSS